MLDRLRLGLSIWKRFVWIKALLRRRDLGDVTRVLGRRPRILARQRHPVNLGRAVWKALNPGSIRVRCLPTALVHYRLLVEQGLPAELVIGLSDGAESPDAHAWVEVDGYDVGPPPGRGGRLALARYGRESEGG